MTGVVAVPGTSNRQFDVTFATQSAPGSYSMVLGPAVCDRAGNPMDQNGNGSPGEIPGDQAPSNVRPIRHSPNALAGAYRVAAHDLCFAESGERPLDELLAFDPLW